MRRMRKALDCLYAACAVASGGFLVMIAVAIGLQVAARHLGLQVPSADDVAGLSMAASLFLGLAPTLRAGRHIRVNLLLYQLPGWLRKKVELLVCLMGCAFFAYFSFYAAQMTVESYEIGERTAGLLPIPLWLPQIGMSIGLMVMTVALLDDLVLALRGQRPVYGRSEQAHLEAEGLQRVDGA
jgi:TRAP-type C4-dicarboxylate transport system permease small subunit